MSEITTPVASGVTDVEIRIARRKMDTMFFKQAMVETDGKLNAEYISRLKPTSDFEMPNELTEPAFHGGVQVTE